MKGMRIYAIHNKLNGKYYIGQTVRGAQVRFKEHLTNAKHHQDMRIGRAILKYGASTFELQTLAQCSSQEELNKLETLWILLTNSIDPTVGYNISAGGDGWGIRTPEQCRVTSLSKKGKPMHPNALANLRLGPGTSKGWKFNPQQLERLRESHIGQGRGRKLTVGTKELIRLAHLGRKKGPIPEPQKIKMREAQRIRRERERVAQL